ncbi:MAG: phBC6A51 family helix-turn-helix protein [Agriterribacter sp.]
MAKYTKKRVNKIVKMLESDDYTITEICENVGIHLDTWYDWKKTKPEFSEKIQQADDRRLEMFKKEARSSLLTLIKGKEYEEVHKEYGEVEVIDKNGKMTKEPRMISQKKVKKFIPPNTAAVLFVLKNQDSDNFKEVAHTDLTSKGEKIAPPVTAEQLAALTKQINEMD